MSSDTEPPEDEIGRKWLGVRIGFVLAAIACFFGCLLVITQWGTVVLDASTIEALTAAGIRVTPETLTVVTLDQDQVWAALEWLLMVIGAAVLGDTYRPSGIKRGSAD